MYSDKVMTTFLHEPCSSRKRGPHALSSEDGKKPLHNLCVATKRKKPKGGLDPITAEMARRLRQSRKDRDWTQEELAEQTGWKHEDADDGRALGVSPSAIGNYEQGTRRFSHEEAETFGRVFGLPSAYFLVVVDEHEAEVILAIRKRTEPPRPSSAKRTSRP